MRHRGPDALGLLPVTEIEGRGHAPALNVREQLALVKSRFGPASATDKQVFKRNHLSGGVSPLFIAIYLGAGAGDRGGLQGAKVATTGSSTTPSCSADTPPSIWSSRFDWSTMTFP
jgi:hypothetical protein